jgi:hypothetical protein
VLDYKVFVTYIYFVAKGLEQIVQGLLPNQPFYLGGDGFVCGNVDFVKERREG